MRRLFSFPNPVNEVSARLVAAGVAILCGATLLTRQPILLAPLCYFALLVRTGVVPGTACEACSDISRQPQADRAGVSR